MFSTPPLEDGLVLPFINPLVVLGFWLIGLKLSYWSYGMLLKRCSSLLTWPMTASPVTAVLLKPIDLEL
jgi:hypothetical protein